MNKLIFWRIQKLYKLIEMKSMSLEESIEIGNNKYI